jgi:TRAP-type C4-dicarboxylate transport system permease large subunit
MGLTLSLINYYFAIRDKLPKDQKLVFRNVLKKGKEAFWSLLAPLFLVGGMLLGVGDPDGSGGCGDCLYFDYRCVCV